MFLHCVYRIGRTPQFRILFQHCKTMETRNSRGTHQGSSNWVEGKRGVSSSRSRGGSHGGKNGGVRRDRLDGEKVWKPIDRDSQRTPTRSASPELGVVFGQESSSRSNKENMKRGVAGSASKSEEFHSEPVNYCKTMETRNTRESYQGFRNQVEERVEFSSSISRGGSQRGSNMERRVNALNSKARKQVNNDSQGTPRRSRSPVSGEVSGQECISGSNKERMCRGVTGGSASKRGQVYSESINDEVDEVRHLSGKMTSLLMPSPSHSKFPRRTDYPEDVFDICISRTKLVTGLVRLQPSLFQKSRERRKALEKMKTDLECVVYGPGLVVLKKYLNDLEQAQIVHTCRLLGKGPGGFYQPCFSNGNRMHLHMMCLGKDWDPESSRYGDIRAYDGTKLPQIPDQFTHIVDRALRDAHGHLRCSALKDLDIITPDICIVNFYQKHGKLGFHQDKDESRESISKGLPVVSFSIGDSAEFLYGMDRDPDKAENLTLESGDVLIFGGESRLIFHGVRTILPNTGPKFEAYDESLRPGRLNLTFRQY